jgi:hypothetical protein
MKQMKKDLKSVAKSLKVLTQKTEKMAKRLERITKAAPPKKRRAKPKAASVRRRVAKKAKKVTAIDNVLNVIKRRKKGATTAQIKGITGCSEKKIWDIVNRAKRQGKVKSLAKGVYISN